MEFELTPGRRIGLEHPCFVIAEVGQNHQGDVSIAMELIRTAKRANCDCVKLQKSCLSEKFTQNALNRPYRSVHSFAPDGNYGDHKRAIELTDEQFRYLQLFAMNESIAFTASAMDPESVDFLAQIEVPFIKIGSGDTNNFPLIRQVATKQLPVVYSTGMHPIEIVEQAYNIFIANNVPAAILYCVSSYPTPLQQLNLNVIKTFQQSFPRSVIGYSGHELGIAPTLAAVALGAKVIERHITMDKQQKGNDHASSLEPDELKNMVKQIRQVEMALGNFTKARQPAEEECYRKLGKSVVAKRDIRIGTTISEEDLAIKVAEPPGLEAHLYDSLIGKKAIKHINGDEAIQCNDVNLI